MPSGGALFGNTAVGPGSTGGNKHLVEFRAGKLLLKDKTLEADKRKGLLYLYQSEDSLMHFCWQDRTTGVVEDDLIIFPEDCEYTRIPECTTGRAYLLKFRTSTRRFFFWLQEPKTDNDEENCKRINELLNNPASAVASHTPTEQNLQSLLNNMSQSQIMQLLGGQIGGLSNLMGSLRSTGGGSARTTVPSSDTNTPAITHRPDLGTRTSSNDTERSSTENVSSVPSTPNASGTGPIQLADFQQFLQGFIENQQSTGNSSAGKDSGTTGAKSSSSASTSVDLSTAFTSEALTNILSQPEALQILQQHLPPIENGDPQETLRTTLSSPQFQQAIQQFSGALESGQLAPVFSQLSVDADAVKAAAQGNMLEFVKALQKKNTTDSNTTTDKSNTDGKCDAKKPKKNDDDDEGDRMQTD